MNEVVIFAGGVGSRMGSRIPKQFLEVDGVPVIIHTIRKFAEHPDIDGIVVVSNADYLNYCSAMIEKYEVPKVYDVIPGGETGQLSICRGVWYLAGRRSETPEEDLVLIHDGVRPMIDHDLISRVIACASENGNCIPCSKAIETVIRIGEDGEIREVVDRSECRSAKAPQCFHLQELACIHEEALKKGIRNSIDSATLMSSFGVRLHTVECGPENIKITTPNDFYTFEALYRGMQKEE
ncbi:MAG: IspD/TarI family cytidylyltransferase [Lachnospiraceae bacterium]|nr:IspD/TarI family cytidylyltransferase [Lachnospiraceae bacterium]